MNKSAVCKQVAQVRTNLRQVQYKASALRQEWLETNACNVAGAAKEMDWQKKMREMVKQGSNVRSIENLQPLLKGPIKAWIGLKSQQLNGFTHTRRKRYADMIRVSLSVIQLGARQHLSSQPIHGNSTSIIA
jgi:hypothetical protein